MSDQPTTTPKRSRQAQCDELIPYLKEIRARPRTPEELELIANLERLERRPLAEWEKKISVAQARMIGHI